MFQDVCMYSQSVAGCPNVNVRILKKPNIADALEHFESLALRSEAVGDYQVAGLCYKSAAKCAASLGHSKHESNYFMKSATAFLRAEIALISGGYISTEENLQEVLKCFNEAYDRFSRDDIALAVSATLGMSKKLSENLKKPQISITLLDKAIQLLSNFPTELLLCLREKMLLLIENDFYVEALKICSEAISTLETLPINANSSAIHLELETHRILLLLHVQPPASQVTKKEASILEKLTWIDGSEDEITDINSMLSSAGLPFFSANMFILLQSLVMATQSYDSENIVHIETSLRPHIKHNHADLLRALVKKIQNGYA